MRVIIRPGTAGFLSDVVESGPHSPLRGGDVEALDLDLENGKLLVTARFGSVVPRKDLDRIISVLKKGTGIDKVAIDFKVCPPVPPKPNPLSAVEAALSPDTGIDGDPDAAEPALFAQSALCAAAVPSESGISAQCGTLGDNGGQTCLTGDPVGEGEASGRVRTLLEEYWTAIVDATRSREGRVNGWLADPGWEFDGRTLKVCLNNALGVKELKRFGCDSIITEIIEETAGMAVDVVFEVCDTRREKAEELAASLEKIPGDLPKVEAIQAAATLSAERDAAFAKEGGSSRSQFNGEGSDGQGRNGGYRSGDSNGGSGQGWNGSESGKRGGGSWRDGAKRDPDAGFSVFKRPFTEEHMPIASLDFGHLGRRVAVKGEIFSMEKKETRTGRQIVTVKISDGTDSVVVKFFAPQGADEEIGRLTQGTWISVEGNFENDQYLRDDLVNAKAVKFLEGAPVREIRKDEAPAKRVELHCHSGLSAMDAIPTVSDIIKRVAEWGHPAIAITDHGVLQGFPELCSAAKKRGIKAIYGIEAYLVNDMLRVMVPGSAGMPAGSCQDTPFVVFDLETTGFNPVAGQIIEIGAVRLQGGEVTGEFSSFVACQVDLPPEIVKLTGITDEMLTGAPPEAEVLKNFMEWAGSDTLVAHNAFGFDIPFMKHRLSACSLPQPGNPVLDTLPLSQALNHHIQRHALKNLVAEFKIKLESHHRAVDDSAATAELLKIFIGKLADQGIVATSEIDSISAMVDVKSLRSFHAVILVKNKKGLKNLYRMVSDAHLDNFYKHPRILKSDLAAHREGLLVGTACSGGELYKAILMGSDDEELKSIASFYDYIEIMPVCNNRYLLENSQVSTEEGLRGINRTLLRLGESLGRPVVATSDAHYIDPEDEIYRRILLAGQKYHDADKESGIHLKTTTEMLAEFSYLGEEKAFEVVVGNPVAIADSIEVISPVPEGLYPPRMDGAEDEIRRMTMEKAREMYGDPLPEIVEKRVAFELESIIGNGYAVLYLIAQKLVSKSLEDGYMVGSRGSVGSSVVAFFSGITEVNALPPHYLCEKCRKSEFVLDGSVACGADLPDRTCMDCSKPFLKLGFEIPFEVFMGFKGDKVPDIDLNFSGKYQSKIHKYTEELFGSDHVFRAGTIATVQDKTAMGFVRGYFEERGIRKRNAEIERLASGCTGVRRTTGQHPGGLMVVPQDMSIYDFCPVQRPANKSDSDVVTTHFDYHSIHDNLVKLDLLGHDDPTVIKMLEDFTGVDARGIHLDDKATLSLFTTPAALGVSLDPIGCETGTLGIPEFGTKFVRQMLMDTRPRSFGELVLISGLSHGTNVWVNNAQDFIRSGDASLKEVVAVRDDIMNFLMKKGVDPSASFKIMEFVRKGKGAKEKAKMDEYAELMRSNGVPEWYIESCRRISYMFPKAHAVAYVVMAFRIAWFKINHPEAFYATYFSTKGDDFDAELVCGGPEKVLNRIREIETMGNAATKLEKDQQTMLEVAYEMYGRGVKVLPVSLAESLADEFKLKDKALLPPFSSLKGLGAKVAQNIVEVRSQRDFKSIEDLRASCGINKTVMEVLERHGCLRGMPETAQMSLFS